MKLFLLLAASLTLPMLGCAQPADHLTADPLAERIAPAQIVSGVAAAAPPLMAVCVAGLEIALGGANERPVRVALSERPGRCFCPEACGRAALHLEIGGVRFGL